MAFGKLWAKTVPPDTGESPTLGAGRIRDIKTMITERLPFFYGFDVNDGETDETQVGAKYLPFLNQGSNPTVGAGFITLFAKTVSTKVELHVKDADGNVIQITSGGALKVISAGIIVMWNGTIATIPSGWVFCNGSNSTPDLRDKFIVGAKEDSAGVAKTNVEGSLTQSGGASTHSHGAGTYATPAHDHGGVTGGVSFGSGTGSLTAGALDTTHNHSISSQSAMSITGSSETVSNLPPYYALAFIQKS